MSRTKRNIKHINSCALRNPKVSDDHLRAIDELSDYGFTPSNRLKSLSSALPSSHDDLVASAWYELDYKVN